MKERKIKVIGLCGRSGSGKGYVSEMFASFGVVSIDTDKVYHKLLEPIDGKPSLCLSELCESFGPDIVADDNRLDRRALSLKVFGEGNEAKLARLNAITHKYIYENTVKLIGQYEEEGRKAVIIDAPVLFESGFSKLCDITVCVTAPLEIICKRVCKRDNRSESEIRDRIASQKDNESLRALCDEEIVNDGFSDVNAQVLALIEKYSLCASDKSACGQNA